MQRWILKINEDDCRGLASEMAYRMILALIPGLIFIFSLFGLIGQRAELLPMVMQTLEQLAPPYAVQLLKNIVGGVFQSSSGGLTLLGLAIALWSAAGGASVVIKGLIRAYNIPKNNLPFWYVPVMSMVILLSLGLMIFIAANLIIFGDLLINMLRMHFGLPIDIVELINSLRWFVIVLGMISFATYVYALVMRRSHFDAQVQSALPGALVFVSIWIAISLLFSIYVNNFQRFNPVYGSLGAVILLLTWFYLTALSILVGGEFAAVVAEFRHRKR